MEKCEKPSGNGNSKKYKFYRKPSIKKKVPEVKQTKTSLARMLKANPLLTFETKKENDVLKNEHAKLEPVNSTVPTVSIRNFGPNTRSNNNSLSRQRLSSSDFNEALLSSTRVDTDITKPPSQAVAQPKASGSREQGQKNNHEVVNNDKRKSLSSQHLDKKKKELQEITRRGTIINHMNFAKNGLKPLRRSLSVDSCSRKGMYGCYTIEEENSYLTESQSMKDLSQSKKRVDTPIPHGLKPKIPKENKTNCIYKIDCNECNSSYIGQTSQYLKKRINNHINNIKTNKEATALAKHAIQNQHQFNFEQTQIIETENHTSKRLFKEMVQIKKHPNAVNFHSDVENLSSIYSNLIQ